MQKLKPKQYIREWRKFRALTQEQLAQRMGVARSYISHVEKGNRRYDQPFLEAAAKALNCAPGDLIMRPPGTSDQLREVIDALSPEAKKRALTIIKALKDSEAA